MVVQRDYVSLGRPAHLRHKSSNSRKKQSSLPSVFSRIILIVLITFVGSLYIISPLKRGEPKAPQGNKITDNHLPSKPEERWHYIKELENRQLEVVSLTEYSVGNKNNLKHLTEEQIYFSAQI